MLVVNQIESLIPNTPQPSCQRSCHVGYLKTLLQKGVALLATCNGACFRLAVAAREVGKGSFSSLPACQAVAQERRLIRRKS